VWEAPPEAFKVEDCQMVRAAPVPAINPATPETPVVPVAQ
jgi:hypothetical protein